MGEVLKPLISRGVFVGGPINSIDIYACQHETNALTVGHINAWANAEKVTVRDVFTHGVILSSIDKRRVIHLTGWKNIDGMKLFYAFEDFKRRADDKDGSPAALKESTHTYRTMGQYPPNASINFGKADPGQYPHLFTVDVFTCKTKDCQDDLLGVFKTGLSSVATSTSAPEELLSLHVLKSTDPLACAVIGVWGPGLDEELGSPEAGPPKLARLTGWADCMLAAKKLAIPGTYSDILEKADPLKRMYYVSEIIVPHTEGSSLF